MHPRHGSSSARRHEDGYVLAGVIILLAVFMILMAMAAPRIRESIRRDQEVETMHRGRQYIRAVQLYYRKFHRYPGDMDALLDTNGLRFLRKKFPDPITGKSDWKPVFMGQNRAPLSMGYFGQVLNLGAALSSVNGAAPANSILGTPPDSAYSSFSDGSSSSNSGNAPPGTAGSPPVPGQVFGAGIIGFSPVGEKKSILVYKTKSHYKEWEFVYDPLADPMMKNWWIPPTPVNTGAPGFNGNPSAGPAPAPVSQ